jgi:hypothetical protein
MFLQAHVASVGKHMVRDINADFEEETGYRDCEEGRLQKWDRILRVTGLGLKCPP